MTKTSIFTLMLMAAASQGCITPRPTELATGAKILVPGDVRVDRPVDLVVAPDRSSAELRDGENVLTLTLARRSDPDTWNVSCGQHYLEETFDVVAPEQMTLDGRTYRAGVLTANCGGPGAHSVKLFLDDVGNSGARYPHVGDGDHDTMLVFRDPSEPWPPPPVPGASDDRSVSSSP